MPQLGRKIGPLPLWAWGGIIGGGALGFILYQRRAAAEAAAESSASPVYEAYTDYGQIDPNTGVPYALEGTGTGAFGPINPDSGIPYAFEAGAIGAGGYSAAELLNLLTGLGELFPPRRGGGRGKPKPPRDRPRWWPYPPTKPWGRPPHKPPRHPRRKFEPVAKSGANTAQRRKAGPPIGRGTYHRAPAIQRDRRPAGLRGGSGSPRLTRRAR